MIALNLVVIINFLINMRELRLSVTYIIIFSYLNINENVLNIIFFPYE